MSWLTDDEQRRLIDEEPGPITDRINRQIAIAIRQVEERRIKLLEQKQNEQAKKQLEYDEKFLEVDGFIAKLRRQLGFIAKS
jgi:hypothetical protein